MRNHRGELIKALEEVRHNISDDQYKRIVNLLPKPSFVCVKFIKQTNYVPVESRYYQITEGETETDKCRISKEDLDKWIEDKVFNENLVMLDYELF